MPEVWVPPQHVRDLRALISHRRRLVSLQTTAKNRLQSVLHRLNVPAPEGDPFAHKNREWWDQLELSTTERLRVRQDFATLAHVAVQIGEVDVELRELSTSERRAEMVLYLVQLRGIALLSAMTILSAVGEVERFPSAKQLVGYAGLARACTRAAKRIGTRASRKKGGATYAL